MTLKTTYSAKGISNTDTSVSNTNTIDPRFRANPHKWTALWESIKPEDRLKMRDKSFFHQMYCREIAKIITKNQEQNQKTLILDCGAGYCNPFTPTLDKFKDSFLTINLDITFIQHDNHIVARIEQMPIKTESVDVIYSFCALDFCDLDLAIPELRRVLKDGGHGFVIVNNKDFKKRNYIQLKKNAEGLFNKIRYILEHDHDPELISSTMMEIFKKTNFNIARILAPLLNLGFCNCVPPEALFKKVKDELKGELKDTLICADIYDNTNLFYGDIKLLPTFLEAQNLKVINTCSEDRGYYYEFVKN